MEKKMMIDYRTIEDDIVRTEIDDCEFCVRNGRAWFLSDGKRMSVELSSVIQVYFV